MKPANGSPRETAKEPQEAETSAQAGISSAKKRVATDERPGTASAPKRRRRAFSCLSCQKLKCRCDYDAGAPGCHRCQTLRIECSLRGESIASASDAEFKRLGSSIDERIQAHEYALRELKQMVEELKEQRQPPISNSRLQGESTSPEEQRTPTGDEESSHPEYFSNPADKGTKSAPIVVLREISEQVTRGYRRLLEHVNLDLVQLQIIDDQTTDELITLYLRHQGHTLLACSGEELRQASETRKVSAFLHSACCLIGIAYREDLCGGPHHRQVYEQVRNTLGQALLSSLLNMEEINAILIMSNNANTPNSHGLEYVDSWLLTGYCAQQAMLSISFSKIVDNIKRGNSTVGDHRAIHLWSTICLQHLHWAATTGRPSVIPRSYVNQCNILLSFYQATIQDSMLVAEISLYSALHDKLAGQSSPGDGSECEEFLSWRHKWNHLLLLSTSSMLKIGYHAACLILAVRTLEETGHAIRLKTFLPSSTIDQSNESNIQLGSDLKSSKDGPALKANVCKYALLVLQTFLDMPKFLMDAIPTCSCLCIGYCALVLAHCNESQSKISDQVSLDLITRVDQWIRTTPGKSWSFKYGALARNTIETRLNGGGRLRQTSTGAVRTGAGEVSGIADEPASVFAGDSEERLTTAVPPFEPGAALPSFDTSDQSFPNMEDFFGGGFLDFMR
ncbi:hypothetical protein F5Y15DRAFT_28516 [Xylariaceae sp. FL0016]|nr:hypothetical protein F5Y15DRAFT_28516 [Xylariaceae sp. FL0016]